MILAGEVILAWNSEDNIKYDFIVYERTNKKFRREKAEYKDKGKNMKE